MGFYNIGTVLDIDEDFLDSVVEKYKNRNNKSGTGFSETEGKGGELASEQMKELELEMISSDAVARRGSIFSMNNLHEIEFTDFLVLQKIIPRIFILET